MCVNKPTIVKSVKKAQVKKNKKEDDSEVN